MLFSKKAYITICMFTVSMPESISVRRSEMCVLNVCTLSEFVWGGVLHASKSLIGFWHRSDAAFSGSGTNETWSMAT